MIFFIEKSMKLKKRKMKMRTYNNNSVFKNDIICDIEIFGNNYFLNSGIQIILRANLFWMNYKKINGEKFSFVYDFKGVLLVLQRNEKYNSSTIKFFCDKNGNYLEGA